MLPLLLNEVLTALLDNPPKSRETYAIAPDQ